MKAIRKTMTTKNIPIWILSGIIIFPVIIVLGIIIYIITLGEFNALFWLIIPSIIFEESFENCCYTFSNNQLANLSFALFFWFVIGATVGLITDRFKK